MKKKPGRLAIMNALYRIESLAEADIASDSSDPIMQMHQRALNVLEAAHGKIGEALRMYEQAQNNKEK